MSNSRGKTGKRVTLKQVAEALGVSVMTVSNAYNRPDQLSTRLREKVLETAGQLGYTGPDPLARGFRLGRTGTVGVIYDTPLSYALDDAAAAAFLRGVAAEVERENVGLLLIPGFPNEVHDPSSLSSAMVDGFIVYSVAEADPLVAMVMARALPVVIVDQPILEGVPLVGVDDQAAAREAAQHLLDLGHERFGVVSFGLRRDGQQGFADLERQRSSLYPVSRARLEGYAEALEAAGVPWAGVPVYECQGSSLELGREAGKAMFSLPERPTAILATSDRLALGVLEAARAKGLLVPEDASVVGFDDTPEGKMSEPTLTSVHQDHESKGRLAGQLLIASLRGDQPATPPPLPTQVVARVSSAKPKTI